MTKTLAQMTEKERAECCGMWVNTPLGYGILVDHLSMNGYHEPVVLIASYAKLCDGRWDWDQLDLRPNLPRAWEMDGLPNRGLAPDLPEPEDPGIFVPDGKGWLPCGPHGPSVWTAPNSLVMVQRIEPGDLTPAQARELAHALLAAANHAEEQAHE